MLNGNMKLSNDFIDRITGCYYDEEKQKYLPFTGTEIDLILYLSKRQNAFGSCRDIYYRDVYLELGICKQTFYNALYSLEEKGILIIDWTNGRNWNVTLIDAITPGEYKKGYVKTNRDFLYSIEFKALKVNEKRLILKLLKVYRPDSHFKISVSMLCKWLGIVSKELVMQYMEHISKFFDIRLKGEIYIIGRRLDFSASMTEREHFLYHKIRTFCRNHRISYVLQDIKDLVIVIGQYIERDGPKLMRYISETCLQHRTIEPQLINYMMCTTIGNNG